MLVAAAPAVQVPGNSLDTDTPALAFLLAGAAFFLARRFWPAAILFTLAGSLERGRRPGFDRAEEPKKARSMFDVFVRALGSTGIEIQTGRFREMMLVALENDGPVTFIFEA